MCRILFLKWTNTSKALEYIDAFHEAGNNDPYLKEAVDFLDAKDIETKHIHGWWYLLVTKDKINTYLNWNAFLDDKKWFDHLKQQIKDIDWEFLLMAELRVTDEWYISALNAHPFHFMSRNGYEMYLFYNWLIDHRKIAELEWIDYKNFINKNGTVIMWLSIVSWLESGFDFKKSLEKPKQALKSWYNIMSFIHDDKGKYKAFINAYTIEKLYNNPKYYEYIKVLKKQEEDLFFAWSSTIELYRKDDYSIMKNGELLEFELDFIDEYCFNNCDV